MALTVDVMTNAHLTTCVNLCSGARQGAGGTPCDLAPTQEYQPDYKDADWLQQVPEGGLPGHHEVLQSLLCLVQLRQTRCHGGHMPTS